MEQQREEMAAGVLHNILYRKLPLLLTQGNVDTPACAGCCPKVPQGGWVEQQKFTVYISGSQKSESKVLAGSCLLCRTELRVLVASGVWQQHPNLHTAFSRVRVGVQTSPFCKETSHIGLGACYSSVISAGVMTSAAALFPQEVTPCGLGVPTSMHELLWDRTTSNSCQGEALRS